MATLGIDIGGTGLKASVLDGDGTMLHDRVRVLTPYPLTPDVLAQTLHALVAPLPAYERVSVGFPGVVRHNAALTAPHFVRRAGPGTAVDDALVAAWSHCDIGGLLARTFGHPVRVLNDADLQALGVAAGRGVEVVVTLGTGFGTAILEDGHLGPHLELAHHRFRKGQTYDEQLGDVTRKTIGNARWNGRVDQAIDNLRVLTQFDHLYLGGGNTKHLRLELAADVTVIDTNAGILAATRLWDDARVPNVVTSAP